MAEITILIAFLAGIVSFLSPCILPLVPAYLSFLAGTSVSDAKKKVVDKKKIIISSVFFVLGFSLIFSVVGVVLNSLLGSAAFDVRIWLSRIGGAVIIVFGLYLTGILRRALEALNINYLSQTHRLQPKRYGSSYLTSFVFGVAFAIGWTPCVGAILGGILTLAITEPASAFNLMLAYSLGIGIPFIVAGGFISQMAGFIVKYSGFMGKFTIVMGFVLIALGVLVMTGYIGAIAFFVPMGLGG
ncbi:MAG: cytochrome C biogenesis protein [Candidatus Aenigmarchaeota archaeon]|nr:cytochrome C biogenesis protein [Candidatus Aenigmarchaeota archaeon]